MKNFFTKNWLHFVMIAIMAIITLVYFKPQLSGQVLRQHDIEQWKGSSHEIEQYRERTGKEPLWTNSMFGGMPTTQISVIYEGNWMKEIVGGYFRMLPPPAGVVLLYMIGFYILALCLRLNPFVGLFGAILFAFSSYDIIILQAGHVTKAVATAFLAPTLGAFILAYKRNLRWGILLSALFMTFELGANHVQVTYYFAFVLLFTGIAFFVDAIIQKRLPRFLLASGGILAAYLVAMLINYGNIGLTTDYAKHTIRGANDITINPDGTPSTVASDGGLNKDYITQWSYGVGETFTLLSPNVKGGGSFAIEGSQFSEIPGEMEEFTTAQAKAVGRYPAYWGEQPFTSGPVYVGIIAIYLALLGIVFLRRPVKWALLAATLLAIMLSWGKNFMVLTDFFIDYVPGYNKFRTVTIILIVAELCIPVLAVLFLNKLMKERELIRERKKAFFITSGAFLLFLLVLLFSGLGDGYSSAREREQLNSYEAQVYNQLMQIPPQQLQQNYGLDINNQQQVTEFIAQQTAAYEEGYRDVKQVRAKIYSQSMWRSIGFCVLAIGCLALFFASAMPAVVPVIVLTLLGMFDMMKVSSDYLNSDEKYWEEKTASLYPFTMTAADQLILDNELRAHPELVPKIEKAAQQGRKKAEELGLSGAAKQRAIDAYRMSELNFNTNYRVFNVSEGFSSANTSYFHKSLGGYHGAKLRNIQNLYDFHIENSNNKVFNMLNVKYFLQRTRDGQVTARINPGALGSAWFVKSVQVEKTPNEELLNLGNKFEVSNEGGGELLVNGEPVKSASVYGSENLQYLRGAGDTLRVPLSNGMSEGMEVYYVSDVNGNTNVVPAMTMEADTADSFSKYVKIKVVSEFDPANEAVMLEGEAQKLSQRRFTGSGSIRLTDYEPNRLAYEVNADGKQLAVFSEIYYPDGWTATVDGKEVSILKADYLLRAIEIDAGKHKVEFSFFLPKYKTSNTMALIGSILLFALLIGGVVLEVRERRKTAA